MTITLDRLQRDLTLALRSLRRAPVFTAAAIAILGLGIGVSTAMFSLHKSVIFDRLPVAAQEQLAVFHPLDRGDTRLDVPYPYLAEIARDTAVFAGVAGVFHLAVRPGPYIDGTTTIALAALNASPNFFAVLGMRPALGRLFVPDDGRAGAPVVMVLSHDTWRRRFGGDSAVVGRSLIMPFTQSPARVVGVAPVGFSYPAGIDAWVPMPPDYTAQVDIVARLAPGVSLESARAALLAMTHRSNPFLSTVPAGARDPRLFQIHGVEARSLADTIFGSSRAVIVALSSAVALLLLIACVNVGNLVLVRTLGRAREIAVRRALGATHLDVARLFLVEHGLIALAGGAAGLAIALGLLRAVRIAAPAQLPRVDTIGVIGPAIAIGIGITAVALVVSGLAPSLIASRVSSYAALRADARTGFDGKRRRAARRWLVSLQMALAVVLLAGAGLLVRTLARLHSVDLGYRTEHVSMLTFTGPQSVLSTNEKIFDVSKALIRQLEATPGVVAATPIENPPFRGQSFFIMKVAPADVPVSDRERYPFVPFEFVGPSYFRTFDIPIRRGRSFTASDTKGADRVVVINETLAQRWWPNQDPLGKQLVQVIDQGAWTVVGIASDTRFRELKNTGPVVYFNGDQVQPYWSGFVAVRTTVSLDAMLPALRRASREANASLVFWDAKTMDDLLATPLAQPRLSALLLSAFSAIALVLSAIGLYGVLSAMVGHQVRDIGVRLALGATARDVRRLVFDDAMRVVAVGAAIGLIGAVVGGRMLASQLYGVGRFDLLSIGGTCVVLITTAAVAAFLPARRASRIDPARALRAD
jgi:putative ABC transport system permease protein